MEIFTALNVLFLFYMKYLFVYLFSNMKLILILLIIFSASINLYRKFHIVYYKNKLFRGNLKVSLELATR